MSDSNNELRSSLHGWIYRAGGLGLSYLSPKPPQAQSNTQQDTEATGGCLKCRKDVDYQQVSIASVLFIVVTMVICVDAAV